MEGKKMCTVRCRQFEQRMNYPNEGEYSGVCDAHPGQFVYTEDVIKYDRYGTAARFPCLVPEAKDTDLDFTVDPFGWMTTPDD